MKNHYDQNYFDWQKKDGSFGGWAELIKFESHITSNMNVIDFGCGGGFLLNNIKCRNKIGIDINDFARKNVEDLGIKTFKYVKDAPDNWADCIISNHALEHVPDPFNQISSLKEKLKPGGKIIFVVPNDSYNYKSDDKNCHLFSWSPMNLGNLFTMAGFKVIESKKFIHRWPPYYFRIYKVFGPKLFHLQCKIYGYIMRHKCSQARIVATKL
jgi:SAM-dependent methyltransferase